MIMDSHRGFWQCVTNVQGSMCMWAYRPFWNIHIIYISSFCPSLLEAILYNNRHARRRAVYNASQLFNLRAHVSALL